MVTVSITENISSEELMNIFQTSKKKYTSPGLELALMCQILTHKNCNQKIADLIYDMMGDRIAFAILSTKYATSEMLALFSEHKGSPIRRLVASNTKTTLEIIYKLMNDGNPDVRDAAMNNPNTPVELKFRYNIEK